MPGQNVRKWSPGTPCREYEKLKLVAEEVLAQVRPTTSKEQYDQAQQSLLFLFRELKERMDPWHFRIPGGHPCLEECYLHYAARLAHRFLLPPPLPPEPQAPRPPGATPDEVVDNLRTLAEFLHRPRGTYLGRETLPP